MNIEDKIQALLAEAEPLRSLPDEEQESMGLPGIVDLINALRDEQAKMQQTESEDEFAKIVQEVSAKRGPGRPRKVEAA